MSVTSPAPVSSCDRLYVGRLPRLTKQSPRRLLWRGLAEVQNMLESPQPTLFPQLPAVSLWMPVVFVTVFPKVLNPTRRRCYEEVPAMNSVVLASVHPSAPCFKTHMCSHLSSWQFLFLLLICEHTCSCLLWCEGLNLSAYESCWNADCRL
jgi:hypothetical protein